MWGRAHLKCLPDSRLSQLGKLPVHVIPPSRGKVCGCVVQLFFVTARPVGFGLAEICAGSHAPDAGALSGVLVS